MIIVINILSIAIMIIKIMNTTLTIKIKTINFIIFDIKHCQNECNQSN